MNQNFKVITYERVSTDEQANTKSCDDQKTTNDRFINSKGWILAENGDYRDEGLSGSSTERPGLQALMVRCRKDPTIKGIVITESDRIARGNISYLYVRETFKELGVQIHAVTQPMIDGSIEGELIGEVFGAINGYLAAITKRKSMRALDLKAERGWWPGRAPLGYKNTNIGTEERPERIIEIDDEKAVYVKQIPSLYIQGNSYQEIADYFYEQGLRGNSEGKVSSNEIRLILFNDFYLGEYEWRGIRYKALHKPLLNRYETQIARNKSKETGHLHPTHPFKEAFPFKKIPLLCKDCNCKITAEKKIKKYKRTNRTAEYILYHCTKSKGGWKGCPQPSINRESLIKEFAQKAISPIEIDQELSQFLFEEMNNEMTFNAHERDIKINTLKSRLGQLDNELSKLMGMYLSGKIIETHGKSAEDIYEEFRLNKESEKEKLINSLEKLKTDNDEWKEKASNFFSLLVDATNKFLEAPEEKQAAFLKTITSNVFLDNKTLIIEHKFPFNLFAEEDLHNSLLPR